MAEMTVVIFFYLVLAVAKQMRDKIFKTVVTVFGEPCALGQCLVGQCQPVLDVDHFVLNYPRHSHLLVISDYTLTIFRFCSAPISGWRFCTYICTMLVDHAIELWIRFMLQDYI